MKIYLHGVDDPETVCKVLSAIVMDIMKMNYEILLDNFGQGSLVLYITVTKKARNEERFINHLKHFLTNIMEKGKIVFTVPGSTSAVIVISDPLIDHCKFLF